VKNRKFGYVNSERQNMQNTGVLLYYIPGEGKPPLILGKSTDYGVFLGAASAAIQEAEGQARKLTGEDPILAAAQLQEVGRLRELLSLLVPSLGNHAPVLQ
jgi:hypothetical protein